MNDKDKRKYLKERYAIYVKTISLGAEKYLIAYRYIRFNVKWELVRPTLLFNHLFSSMDEIIKEVEKNV